MASKIFFSHQKVYFWISAFDHRAIVLDKMHIVHWGCDVVSNLLARFYFSNFWVFHSALMITLL